ncbi:geranylgeranyl reductase [Methanococcus vannielii SB]|uniref:Geranylgeranyl reductase n=1 Tax=Methanococcus vannielii (strain ATCC 35089 / DSM 1224 / JCM 13029 / OCM 148 / SB) TaxID=406327 RepID=A6UPM4_METVS|nr:NAD(P)/FAD-dependent oxidoreductase [Methanococcus vannielii]ABR54446.1 geranylgeranyl reductase [Methanococcus vannielii SB]
MDFEKYDIIIVGGGPAGFITGENITDKKVLVLEEHQEIGVPLQCAGLISVNGVKELGNPKGSVNKVRGANIFSKNNVFTVGNEKVRAEVFERKVMDKDIAKRASKRVDVLMKSYGKIKNSNQKRRNYITKSSLKEKFQKLEIMHLGESYEVCPKIIIGADGIRSNIGKSLQMNKKREIISGIQIEYANAKIDDDFVNVFYDKRYSERFFTWIIPLGNDRVRVGTCDSNNSYKKLTEFLKNNRIANEILKNATPIEFTSGAIPIGYSKTVTDNVMLVGDSAGQVKPLSGGGLYYGAKCGKICANTINNYFKGNYSLEFLKSYEKDWKKEFSKEIDKNLKIRRIFNMIDDGKIDRILEYVTKNNLLDIINEKGDMDSPSSVVWPILEKAVFGK